ncbi:MAG: hypothetical protein JWQ30_1035 [Sediminibacterium sp.]|nr:hypothetical protein [Sediminibacterium sp.]
MSLWNFLFGWLGKIFKSTGKFADKVLPIVISVTNGLKSVVDSPVVDIITAITPTGVDDLIVSKIRQAIPLVLKNTALAQDFLHLQTPEAILQALRKKLQDVSDTEWEKFWVDFSGMLAYYLADGNLSVGESIALAQYWYHNKPQ